MKHVGFLCNVTARSSPWKALTPSVLNRAVLIDAILRSAGFRLFIYSPRDVSRDANDVPGYFIEEAEFVAGTSPVPEVNGNWTSASHRLIDRGMGYRDFLSWTKAKNIEIYVPYEFSDLAGNKHRTARLVSRFSRTLHPLTEQYEHSAAQIESFRERSDLVVLKPRSGNKGNGIILLRKDHDGYSLTYHRDSERTCCSAASAAAAVAVIREFTSDDRYVIQQGIETARCDDAAFDIRVIMVHDGQAWHTIHEARVGAPGSGLSNVSQGGVSLEVEDVLSAVFGPEEGRQVMDDLIRTAHSLARHLDAVYPQGLMEIALDLMIDRERAIHLAEINTKPGLVGAGFHRTVFDRTPDDDAGFARDVIPHTTYLARFLMAKMEQR